MRIATDALPGNVGEALPQLTQLKDKETPFVLYV
jgi:hypothetical protein